MTVTVKPVDFVAIKSGDELTIKAADDLAAEILIKTYVPEYPDHVTYAEAYELALSRDAEAADDLEASILATLGAEDKEDDVAADVVNMLLANAERADAAKRETNGPWEML